MAKLTWELNPIKDGGMEIQLFEEHNFKVSLSANKLNVLIGTLNFNWLKDGEGCLEEIKVVRIVILSINSKPRPSFMSHIDVKMDRGSTAQLCLPY